MLCNECKIEKCEKCGKPITNPNALTGPPIYNPNYNPNGAGATQPYHYHGTQPCYNNPCYWSGTTTG